MKYLNRKIRCLLAILTILFLASIVNAIPSEQWNKTFGGSGWDSANLSGLPTSDGGYILAGQTDSYGAGWEDVWLIKTDASGNQQWNRTFGGSGWDSAYSVQPTSDGGYILAGQTSSYGAGGTDVWLIKTDASGNQQWNKTFGGTGYDYGGSVMQTSDGGYILTVDSNDGDVWLIKLSGEGAASSIGYSATVATGQNTYVQSSNGTFGLLLKGQTKTINNSVLLNNTGDISAKVEARFNDSIAGVFGLISGANVLNATNFALGIPSNLVPLSNLGVNMQVAVAPPGVTAMDARLSVPSNQIAGDYSGTVILTFSNLV
jgi:predicted secreted protein